MSDQSLRAVLERLTKWRSVFAAWQLGTRSVDDPECKAVKDHREVSILMRAELSAMLKILLDKKVCTVEEFQKQMEEEAEFLSKAYEGKFPGMKATDQGIEYDIPKARETMRNWRP